MSASPSASRCGSPCGSPLQATFGSSGNIFKRLTMAKPRARGPFGFDGFVTPLLAAEIAAASPAHTHSPRDTSPWPPCDSAGQSPYSAALSPLPSFRLLPAIPPATLDGNSFSELSRLAAEQRAATAAMESAAADVGSYAGSDEAERMVLVVAAVARARLARDAIAALEESIIQGECDRVA